MKDKIDSFDAMVLTVFISIILIGVGALIRSNRERKQNIEATRCLAKGDDGREYELGKLEVFGHEFFTIREYSSFDIVHSPECPCHMKVKGDAE